MLISANKSAGEGFGDGKVLYRIQWKQSTMVQRWKKNLHFKIDGVYITDGKIDKVVGYLCLRWSALDELDYCMMK